MYHSQNPLPLSAIAKKVTSLPILTNGQIDSFAIGNTVIENDFADMITIGKSALANNDFPEKIRKVVALNEFDPQKTLRPTAELKSFEYNF